MADSVTEDSMSYLQVDMRTEGQQIVSNCYENSVSHLDYFCIWLRTTVSMYVLVSARLATCPLLQDTGPYFVNTKKYTIIANIVYNVIPYKMTFE